jgi:serine/threonine protein kinase
MIRFALILMSPLKFRVFQELREKIMSDEILFEEQPQWEEVSESAKDLITKMLDKNPDTRITIANALGE